MMPTSEDYNIRITADGTWWHESRPVTRPGLAKLFASVLSRDEAGAYWLTTPAERGQVMVEDAPFVAVEMAKRSETLAFRTTLDDWVEAGPGHPLFFNAEGRLYINVRDRLDALLARPVYYELMGLAAAGPQGRLGVTSNGVFFPLEPGTHPT